MKLCWVHLNMRKPTIKQKKALENVVGNGGNITKAMRAAGYAEATINTPQKLTESKTWQELLDEYIPDSLLREKIKEGLDANKQLAARVVFKKDAPTSQSAHELPVATSSTDDFIEVADMAVRHKYLETALKVKDKFPAVKNKLLGDEDSPLKFEVEIVDAVHNE